MDILWVCCDPERFVCLGGHKRHRLKSGTPTIRKGGNSMPIFFALAATPLAHFAEGAILAASVYLVSRGAKSSLKNRNK